MKKLILITLTALLAISPFVALAGDIYKNAEATFYNDAEYTRPGLRSATGAATITYNDTDKWEVVLEFSGLRKDYDYVFQFGVLDQLLYRYDCPVTSDKKGKIYTTLTITDLDNPVYGLSSLNIEDYPPLKLDIGYSILRLLDMDGKSGGKPLTSLEPNGEYPDDNPYYAEHPKATMVMRARQDGEYNYGFGSLAFEP